MRSVNDGEDYSYDVELDEKDVEEDDDAAALNPDLPFCGGSIISPRLTTGLGKHSHSRKIAKLIAKVVHEEQSNQ